MHSLTKRSLYLLIALVLLTPTLAQAIPQEEPATEEATERDKFKDWEVSDPPGEWKSITIDTDQTTWSNVDVSPDGTTIVFDMLGDIFSVPITGGEASALTDGIEWNYQPRYSPDGKRIVFVSDRAGGDNLWVMNSDGGDPVEVTKESEHLVHNPSWSPDGAFIVAKKSFTSTRSIAAGEIWMFHSSGGGGLQLVDRPYGATDQKNIAEPAYSIDGRYVFYSQDTTSGRVWQYGKDSTGQIFVIKRLDLETGETETFCGGAGGAVRPTPSPDGKHLAFIKRLPGLTSAIYLKDLKTGHEWPVFTSYERDLQETSGTEGNANAFAWTPDSKSIVFWTGGKFHRLDVASKRAEVIPVHVKKEMKVSEALRVPVEVAPDRFRVKMLRWLQKSPDGAKVAFQALGHIWIKDVKSGKQTRLTKQNDHYEYYPTFSRDGKWIAYTTWDDQDLGQVRTASVDGKQNRVVTKEAGRYTEPSFSPDGRSIVYRKIDGGYLLNPLYSLDSGLYVVPSTGGESKKIRAGGSNPHFGTTNDRVFFSVGGDAQSLELKSINTDGFEERDHLNGAVVTEFRVSPDGRWIAFTEWHNAYVAPFAQTGKKVSISGSTSAFPVKQVSARSGEFLHWSADGKTLHWSLGPTLYTRELKDAFAFLDGAPEELPEPVAEGYDAGFDTDLDKPAGRIALTGARIVTMRDALTGTREVIENGTLIVSGNRIEAVGPSSEVNTPSDAKVFDVSGKTIVPGFVDAHAHGGMGRDEIIPQQNWMQYSNLAFGVTTIHDPSNDSSEIFAAAEMQKTGMIAGPRIFSTGSILYGSHVPGLEAKINAYEDAKFHIQRMKDQGAISVKSYQQPRRDQRQQIVAAGRELGIMVVPEGGMKFQHNMTEIVDGHTSIEHSMTIKDIYDDVLQLWPATGTGYTPTLVVAFGGMEGERFWYDRTNVWENERLMRYTPRTFVEPQAIRRQKAPDDHYNHIHVAASAKQLVDRGVLVNTGAHGQREGLATHWEMWMLEQGGFTPWEALRSASISGATELGMDRDIGSIEAGKLADLVVIDGNPLEDLKRSELVTYTMVNGRMFEAATMNQVAPDEVAREEFFFEKEGGDTVDAATLEEIMRPYTCKH